MGPIRSARRRQGPEAPVSGAIGASVRRCAFRCGIGVIENNAENQTNHAEKRQRLLNWQNCHNMIFVGLSDSYEMMYQAVRRCWRFGQTQTVKVHIVTSEAEGAVKENIERKERQAERMTAEMVQHTKDILEQEIRGTVKVSIPYNPQVKMILPDWIRSVA